MLKKTKKVRYNFSGVELMLFMITIFTVLPLTLYVIHELGHIIVQILLNVPIRICLKGINLSTTCGGYILNYPLPVVFVAGVAGLIASLLPYRYVKNLVFIPYTIKKIYKIKYVNFAVLVYYLTLCLGIFTEDFLVILRKVLVG